MATSIQPALGIQVVHAVPGTPIQAGVQPFDNTHTVIILNTGGGNGYVRWQDFATGPALTAANSIVIPGGGSVTLAIGPLSQRVVATADELVVDGAVACTFQITYVNGTAL
jgi:hypothetical protein